MSQPWKVAAGSMATDQKLLPFHCKIVYIPDLEEKKHSLMIDLVKNSDCTQLQSADRVKARETKKVKFYLRWKVPTNKQSKNNNKWQMTE